MTVIQDDRTKLDNALAKPDWTLLLVSGGPDSNAAKIHDKAEEKITEPYRKTFRIEDLSMLTTSERNNWFAMNERYVVLGGVAKSVADWGSTSLLMIPPPSTNASIIQIRLAFDAGDELE